MEMKAVNALLSAAGGPAFAIRDGRLTLCTPEAQALGFYDGDLPEAILPGHGIPCQGKKIFDFPLMLGGETWLLRSTELDGWSLCYLRRELPFTPAPNEQTLLHAASRIRLSIQDVQTAIERLDNQNPRSAELESSLSLALRSIYRLTHTANNLELFSWLRSGNYRLQTQSINLAARLEDFCREAGGLLQELGVTLSWEFPPEFRSDMADWELISALLWELLANAAANAKDRKVHLEMKRLADSRALFRVINLPERPLDEARFHRHAEPQQLFTEGLGLGLSIVSVGAAVHGGTFLLSALPDGKVEAALSVALHRPQKGVILSSIQPPMAELHPGLVALSELLPRDSFHPDRLL